ncbi:MAG: L-threonylcarbamoyladenylate synthase [Sandaracinaceae bacterium]
MSGASAAIQEAAAVLARGGLVAFPTETVYGLGAAARDERAVARVFEAKGRPSSHPLIVHVASVVEVERFARAIPEAARVLLDRFAPGPLTLILERKEDVPARVAGGQPTIGVRIPDHPVALALLRAFGDGVAAPSANRFGSISPTTAAHVALELGDRVELILDGGACRVGVESTIVDLTRDAPRILRPGGVPAEAIEDALSTRVPIVEADDVRVPGALASHYAPRADVVVVVEDGLATALRDARHRRPVVLGEGAPDGVPSIALPREPEAQARRLYAALREVDERGFDVAFVVLPEAAGLGAAIVDRLRRASAPRTGH